MRWRRNDRGQVLEVVAVVLTAAALAGAGIAALVASSEASRSKALEAKAAVLAPNVFINGLAKEGAARDCAVAVLSQHGVTLTDGEWRAASVPLPARSGDAATDRANFADWRGEMDAYIAEFQAELDQCDPSVSSTSSSQPSGRSKWDGVYDVEFGTQSDGCVLLEETLFVERIGSQAVLTYNYVGSSREFIGTVDTDGSFGLAKSQTRNVGPDQPAQVFTGEMRGTFSFEDDTPFIRDGVFDGQINDRAHCTAEFSAKRRA